MKQLKLIAAAAALGFLAFAQPALADPGEPTHYIMTIEKAELCAAGSTLGSAGAAPVCVDPFVIGTGQKTFDIAAGAQDSPIGSYASINPDTWPVGTTFTYLRATLLRKKTVAGNFPQGSATLGHCVTGPTSGDQDTLATGTDANGAAVGALTDIYEQSVGAPFGPAAVGDLWANGQVHLDANTYTQMIPLTAPYTAKIELPTITVAFDMQTAVDGMWQAGHDCDNNVSGADHCCMQTGDITTHITITDQ